MNLIPYGVGMLGSWIGGKMAGKNKPEQSLLDNQTKAMADANALSKTAATAGTDMTALAGRSFNPVIDHWSRILTGNRGAVMSELAPEISRIGEGYREAAKTSAALNPRGGPRADVMSEMPFSQQRDVTTLMQKARPQAAEQLAGVGGAVGGVGGNLISNSINALNSSTTTGRTMLDYILAKRKADRESGQDLGGTIFDMLSGVDFGKVGSKLGGLFGGGKVKPLSF